MNVKPLMKYFPEIHHLSAEAQVTLLEQAYQASFGPKNKLRIWRGNLISCAILTGLAMLLILVVGPLLKLSSAITATIMILVVLPGFFYIQHKRYINELRPKVLELSSQHTNVVSTP